jgi:hypothetical protein
LLRGAGPRPACGGTSRFDWRGAGRRLRDRLARALFVPGPAGALARRR